jgi:hypothetical protein
MNNLPIDFHASEIATGKIIFAGDVIVSNVTGKATVFHSAEINNETNYIIVLEIGGIKRRTYAHNYGLTVTAV